MKMNVLGMAIFLIGICCLAGEVNTPPNVKAEQISPDSVWQSESWKNIPTYPLMAMDGYIKRNDVNVQFAYDDNNLYFRFDAKDDDILDEASEQLTSGMFIFSDCVELFLRPVAERGYWEFHFTPKEKAGAIFFPSRGRRMPSNVAYLPFPGLKCKTMITGTLNKMEDVDRRWTGICQIPVNSIRTKHPNYKIGDALQIQVCSVAYSLYSDGDEKAQLFYIPGTKADPHYLPAWSTLSFNKSY